VTATPTSERPPVTILVATGIAIGGAAASSVLDLWLVVVNPSYLDGVERLFAIFNLGLVVLNVWFLVGMKHQAQWAWGVMYALVVAGTVLDGIGGMYPYFEFGDFGGVLELGRAVAPNVDWFGGGLFWSWVHLIVIQVPILALLSLQASRRWMGIDTPVAGLDD
jgi:hypothetical protein